MYRLGREFVGWGPVLSVRDPADKTIWTRKNVGILFCCGFKKCVFVENGAILFFVFALGDPYRGRAH